MPSEGVCFFRFDAFSISMTQPAWAEIKANINVIMLEVAFLAHSTKVGNIGAGLTRWITHLAKAVLQKITLHTLQT